MNFFITIRIKSTYFWKKLLLTCILLVILPYLVYLIWGNPISNSHIPALSVEGAEVNKVQIFVSNIFSFFQKGF